MALETTLYTLYTKNCQIYSTKNQNYTWCIGVAYKHYYTHMRTQTHAQTNTHMHTPLYRMPVSGSDQMKMGLNPRDQFPVVKI